MVKKLIAVGAAAATLLVMAGGAFASGRHHRGNLNLGIVRDNSVVAEANTGLNYQGGGGEQEMETGDATATAGQDNVLNSSTCGCERGGRHSRTINVGLVTGNNVAALANTGLNSQEGGVDGVDAESENHHRHHRQETEQELETGDADAFAWQTNVINSSVGEGEEE